MTYPKVYICRTTDGRYVLETHPDAAFQVYTPYDDVPADVLAEVFPAETKPVRKTTKPRRAATK